MWSITALNKDNTNPDEKTHVNAACTRNVASNSFEKVCDIDESESEDEFNVPLSVRQQKAKTKMFLYCYSSGVTNKKIPA